MTKTTAGQGKPMTGAAHNGHIPGDPSNRAKRVQVIVPVAAMHKAPADDAMQVSQALLGEVAVLLERKGSWSFVTLLHNGYEGYVRNSALSSKVIAATHRVVVPLTHRYPMPDLKSQPAVALPMNAQLSVVSSDGDYSALENGGYVFTRHIAALDAPAADFVAVAEQFLHTPYLWGGKSALGIDCSGLVQVALDACNIACPRDSGPQEKALGTALRINDLDGLQRGDLVFWKGHVGIMADASTLLHANAHHMSTVKEPLADAVKRIADKGSTITALKRM